MVVERLLIMAGPRRYHQIPPHKRERGCVAEVHLENDLADRRANQQLGTKWLLNGSGLLYKPARACLLLSVFPLGFRI